MSTILITGGNTGLGFETAKRLLAVGHKLYITSRSVEGGRLAAEKLGCEFLVMDITDEISVQQAFLQYQTREDSLDVLINNAGIPGERRPIEAVDAALLESVFATNVFGSLRVVQAFLPLLQRSHNPVIVNVSSGVGSFAKQTDDTTLESKVISPAYASSKAALSMLTLQYAKALPNMRINAADPGPTNTGGNFNRGRQSVTEGTDAIFRLATLDQNGPTGTFQDRNGLIGW
ncbi:SDR family NAD(P)-dependent oxidoreductase [Enterococcus sp. AD013-P3]|uniref:SDR family NAD(P)-dependent oxidoreductase n=1 Tax=Enterococcus sp. AD013-P3 TaxID=3411036 RepID=UPI003B9334C5